MAVKNRLKEIRHDYRMNQVEFAQFLGISQYQYNRYELQRQQPTLEGALMIAEKLNKPLEHIFYLDKQ
jgi:DNA-binding XRE family transcriptional regulator